MSRVIKLESAGKDRTQLSKHILLAIRELGGSSQDPAKSRDLVAYMVLALEQIAQTIDASVAAWEKRGYWVKADKFRMEWLWAGQYADKMKVALLTGDWGTVALVMTQTAQKLVKVQVPAGHRLGKPWVGAFQQLTRPQ